MKDHETFRNFLNRLIDERSLSLRKLGKISGIDHATLSKIINGKREANLIHLQKLSVSLDIELTTFMHAAGYITEPKQKEDSDIQNSVDLIQKLIKTTNNYDEDFTFEKVKQEIAKYQDYSQTTDGRNKILQEFENKIEKTDSKGPCISQLRTMFFRFSAKKGTVREIALMGAALIYFIITTDLLPDYLLPIGFLDDAVIVQAVLQYMDSKKF
ncbi:MULTISPECIES: DUF1232 domain-containing protein [Virgibacillus]|uniref:DUF1232 domain-containing protein n=1 Tax=Virgibacillus dokdonensis TaxID=302167 RepID=A0A2K9J6U2_9BACI|nr:MULTISPECIES: DUF1232 domain-containing protein [Virgibacillus]AUJ25000.1 helix-turn-helix protein [Virgibacillus dokdonensis]NWO13447.1 DUF1232 domain-containing protein [Virgibacillus sp.]